MLNKDKIYIIKLTSSKTEKELVKLLRDNKIYWIHELEDPSEALISNLFDRINKRTIEDYNNILYLKIEYSKQKKSWTFIHQRLIGNSKHRIIFGNEIEMTANKILRKFKLEKLNDEK